MKILLTILVCEMLTLLSTIGRKLMERNFYHLGLSDKQLFFLEFAQVFFGTLPHSTEREEVNLLILYRNQSLCARDNNIGITLDSHSANSHRVIGAVSNMPEFSSAFQCPTSSLMNRKEKCRVG